LKERNNFFLFKKSLIFFYHTIYRKNVNNPGVLFQTSLIADYDQACPTLIEVVDRSICFSPTLFELSDKDTENGAATVQLFSP